MTWPLITLRGETLDLDPLNPDEHAGALFEATPPDTFKYFLSWPDGWNIDAFRDWLVGRLANETTRMFAVIHRESGRVLGSTSFLDIDDHNRTVEIGATWYTPDARGKGVNPEAKLLLLRYAFEHQNRVRVTLKAHSQNLPSHRAMAGIGAVREGTLRALHLSIDGTPRDTVYFSVIESDWPRVRALLEARLNPPRSRKFTVRPATVDDVPRVLPLVQQITDLHRAMDPQRFTFKPDILDLYAKWLPERVKDERSPFFVAESEATTDTPPAIVGHIVGTVEPEVPIYWTPESGWIHDLFVLDDWRRHGVAQELVRAAVKHFNEIGAPRIRLETAAPNDSARAFFASMGFRPGTTEMLMML